MVLLSAALFLAAMSINLMSMISERARVERLLNQMGVMANVNEVRQGMQNIYNLKEEIKDKKRILDILERKFPERAQFLVLKFFEQIEREKQERERIRRGQYQQQLPRQQQQRTFFPIRGQ